MSRLTDPYQGTISPGATMQGVMPGSGVARGGQQGRMQAITGGTGGVKSPIPNAKGSQAPAPSLARSTPAPAPAGAPAPAAPPQAAPRPTTPAPNGMDWRPVYGWWRINPSAPWSRYVRAWQATPQQGTM